jgi:hypothetical protein
MGTENGDAAMMKVEAREEHRWLQQFVGEWASEIEAKMGPDKPAEKGAGTEIVRALGEVWTLAEGAMPMPDGSVGRSVMTLGYDPAKKKFVGSFIASMMTRQWLYEGTLDEAGTTLTLETEGPVMSAEGGTAPYRDVIEMKSPDHRVMTSHVKGPDGAWTCFMTAHYRRKQGG